MTPLRTPSRVALAGLTALALGVIGGNGRAAQNGSASPAPVLKQYCFQCHNQKAKMGGVNLEDLSARASIGDGFQTWARVASVLEQQQMPPKGAPQPEAGVRQHTAASIRAEMNAYAKKHDGEPGRVTVRRLTSGEYAYAIRDLTGFELDTGIDAASDSVGGEGFTSFGDVQFMQDANLERYLAAAKLVANHAVIGAGPVAFFRDPGKTGFELSAATRIKDIYATHGYRTVSGEGGRPFGLDKLSKAFYAAWLAERNDTPIEKAAALEGVSARFAKHVHEIMRRTDLGYPVSEFADRWRKLPADPAAAKAGIADLQKFVTVWPSWFFARGDEAAGGAGDESPLVFNDEALKAEKTHHFTFLKGNRPGTRTAPGPATVYLHVASVNPKAASNPVVVWKNPTIAFRKPSAQRPPTTTGAAATAATGAGRFFGQAGPTLPLREVIGEAAAAKIGLGPDGFTTNSAITSFVVPMQEGAIAIEFQVDAAMGGDPDQVVRIVISDREDGGAARGRPVRALLGDPASNGYKALREGILQYSAILPPNSHGEPTPADKDPVPQPFDSTYNVPEHDEYVNFVKYIRDDEFVYDKMLDDATRARLDHAWNDLLSSFDYHDHYARLLAAHYKIDWKGKSIATLDPAAFPAEARKYIDPIKADYNRVIATQAAARSRHLPDCLEFASKAWRRPLTPAEKQSLRAFYEQTLAAEKDHTAAVRAVIARVLVSPAFLYRIEYADESASAKPLTNWDLASRLSFFLWSSVPDDELRRAAAAGELNNDAKLRAQVTRMLHNEKARRLGAEFFGQWLGFYRFDQFKGVDTARFPDFTDDVKNAMYDEAVSFFEYVVRNDRPISEMLTADYAFLNKPLAAFYGVKKDVKATDRTELIASANEFRRGGMLRLGAVLTATSAPLRTSPVKRGDWLLRRVLGTPTPPPPADAGSLPADEKNFGGLSLREKLESHKRNATCAACHTRIDPLGFPLEHYDSTGRWRETYSDGKPIYDAGSLPDKTEIAGVDGLLNYLKSRDAQVRRTMASKLVGFALGRTVQASDELLIQRMTAAGGDATFAKLASEIVLSKQFRSRAGRENAAVAQVVRKENGR